MNVPALDPNLVTSENIKILARALSLVENDREEGFQLLRSLKVGITPVIGITGPPGAGKSTLVQALAQRFSKLGKKIAILAVDPSSPFNFGSLLGDRIRMAALYNLSNVYIRSVATRGSLGGLSSKIMEMTDVLKAAKFDFIFIETVGVGQSEVEIAGLADRSVVVLVPESGDEIQHIKSGLMEIAQAFVVNKSDREGADLFAASLQKFLHENEQDIPVFKTVADKNLGLDLLVDWISNLSAIKNDRKFMLLAERAWKILTNSRMKGIDRQLFLKDLKTASTHPNFNLYEFLESLYKH